MTWWNVLKREFKIFDDEPTLFMVSLMSSQKNRDKIKNKQVKIYGDDNYIDIVDFNEISINDFLRGEQMAAILNMDNVVVVASTKGTFSLGD
tara:strand:+ start:145 stop:420 length:276 start_codon:yes stop_codon:yes gene_type:complete